MSRKWQIGLKAASDKVGTALGEVKDDTDVDTALTEAKAEASGIESTITSEVAAFVNDLPNQAIGAKKKEEFEAVLKKAGDDIKAKLTGVTIFADIA